VRNLGTTDVCEPSVTHEPLSTTIHDTMWYPSFPIIFLEQVPGPGCTGSVPALLGVHRHSASPVAWQGRPALVCRLPPCLCQRAGVRPPGPRPSSLPSSARVCGCTAAVVAGTQAAPVLPSSQDGLRSGASMDSESMRSAGVQEVACGHHQAASSAATACGRQAFSTLPARRHGASKLQGVGQLVYRVHEMLHCNFHIHPLSVSFVDSNCKPTAGERPSSSCMAS
jgi:hypothetical protein